MSRRERIASSRARAAQPNSSSQPSGRRACLLACAGLFVLVLLTYLPVWHHDFVYYDDDAYVSENPVVQAGLTWPGVKWAFTTGHASNWHPLTWMSHMLDVTLFGMRPGWHHLVSMLLHAVNAVLLLIVFQRMTGALWPSLFVAALFAVHPLHVESVAWAAERKDVLSTFFWLATMIAYVWYTERPGLRRYLAVVVLLGLGLMAKPMLVTLPLVLLLLDYWPLRRLEKGASVSRLLLEKAPLLGLSAVSSVVTFLVQRAGGAMQVFAALPPGERIANAIVSYATYIGKMFWPAKLAVLYPHPVGGIPIAIVIVAAGLLLGASVLALWYGRKARYLATGWLWYAITLVPVIGIVQVGVQAYADRYTYITLTGLFAIVAFGAADLARTWRLPKAVLPCIAVAILVPLTLQTRRQLGYWSSSVPLFEHTLAVTRDNYVMHNNYGNMLNAEGDVAGAAAQYRDALRFSKGSAVLHTNLANALLKLGHTDEAIEHYTTSLRLDPGFAAAHYNLATALVRVGQWDEAIEHLRIYIGPRVEASVADGDPGTLVMARPGAPGNPGSYREVLVSRPYLADALSLMGYALANLGQEQQALPYYGKALEINPDHIVTHGRAALALAASGRIDDAIAECRVVLEARPNDAEMHCNLGILLQRAGRVDDAIASYRRALAIEPGFSRAADCLKAATDLQSAQ